jgi:hypothetical protein
VLWPSRFARGDDGCSKPWSIEANDPVVTSEAVDQSAQDEILHHGAISVEEDNARRDGIAAFDLMQTHSVALDEDADRRVPALRYHLKHDIGEYQKDNSC